MRRRTLLAEAVLRLQRMEREKLREKLEYMHGNAVQRKLVQHPKDWPWSSWSYYAKGEEGLTRINAIGEELNGKENLQAVIGKLSPDGKTVEFDFLDVSGGTRYGHMHHAVFTIIDADHHTEDWTYMTPTEKPVQAHIDLVRAK